jgi:diguanylate cyclase (GGDEF)-like protein
VYQPFDVLGETAIELIVRCLRGEPVSAAPHWVDTSFVVRESCGCPPGRARRTVAGAGSAPEQRLAWALASRRALVGQPDDATVEVLARGAEAVAAAMTVRPTTVDVPGEVPGPVELDEVLADVYRLDPRPETVVEIAAQLREYADDCLSGAEGSQGVDVEKQLWQVLLSLVRVQARIAHMDSGQYQGDASVRYEVSMDLLRSHEEDPRALRWLRRTGWRGGCLGLWRSSPAGPPTLEIVGMYDQLDPDGRSSPAGCVAPDAFPPAELLAMVQPGSGDMVTVIPVRLDTADWGMLALVAPPDTRVRTGREMTNQCAALLTVALNHEAVLRALHEQESLLRRASLHDPLTDLPNRARFLDQLGQALALTRRDPTRQFAVLFLDLDRFKSVNDTLGHQAGDQLLVQVAGRLRRSLRESDVGARFGGDEFAILLEVGGAPDGAVTLADRLYDAMALPFDVDGGRIQISVSIGIAQGLDRYSDAEEVLRDADVAMYTAKKNGLKPSAAVPALAPLPGQRNLRLVPAASAPADQDPQPGEG